MSWCVNTALTGSLLSAPVPSPAPRARNCLPEVGARTQRRPQCDRTLQDFQLLKWKKSPTMCHCNSSRLAAWPDFHRDREGCLPAKFQVAILKYEVDGSARKGTCQISPAILFFFFFFPNNIIETSKSSEMLS